MQIIGNCNKDKIQKIIQKAINESIIKRNEIVIYCFLKYLIPEKRGN